MIRRFTWLGGLLVVAGGAHAQSARRGAPQDGAVLADRIQAGDRKAALELIAAGADVNAAQPDGTTPLQWAAYRVDRDLVDRLLKRGAKANVANRYGASPLHEAVRVADAGLVGLLLEAGADANAANADGQTALHVMPFLYVSRAIERVSPMMPAFDAL